MNKETYNFNHNKLFVRYSTNIFCIALNLSMWVKTEVLPIHYKYENNNRFDLFLIKLLTKTYLCF